MVQNNDDATGKTPQEKLAELVARRKSGAGQGRPGGAPGQRQAERAAAAHSLSKSKPALSRR